MIYFKKLFLLLLFISMMNSPEVFANDLSTPESAAQSFLLSFSQGDVDQLARLIHPDCTNKEELDIKEKKVPKETLLKFSKSLFGVKQTVKSTEIQTKPGREGWIKVKFEIEKKNGEKTQRRVYVKKDNTKYKIINL